jgi:hypothetical protein
MMGGSPPPRIGKTTGKPMPKADKPGKLPARKKPKAKPRVAPGLINSTEY